MRQPIKLIISYDMIPGQEEACQEYIVHKLGATLSEFGFEFTDAWYTAWGNGPQIMGCGLLDSVESARALLQSKAWKEVLTGLEPYVDNFSIRLVEPAGSFQL